MFVPTPPLSQTPGTSPIDDRSRPLDLVVPSVTHCTPRTRGPGRTFTGGTEDPVGRERHSSPSSFVNSPPLIRLFLGVPTPLTVIVNGQLPVDPGSWFGPWFLVRFLVRILVRELCPMFTTERGRGRPGIRPGQTLGLSERPPTAP